MCIKDNFDKADYANMRSFDTATSGLGYKNASDGDNMIISPENQNSHILASQ